jgi:hypothetical protein
MAPIEGVEGNWCGGTFKAGRRSPGETIGVPGDVGIDPDILFFR